MRRETPLPFFFALLFLFLLSKASTAQAPTGLTDSIPPGEVLNDELRRIEALVKFGPHYKNKNAAGRLLTLNRAVPPLPAAYVPLRQFGPAYKNRKPAATPVDSSAVPVSGKPKLFGPRYKNRGAKSGNL